MSVKRAHFLYFLGLQVPPGIDIYVVWRGTGPPGFSSHGINCHFVFPCEVGLRLLLQHLMNNLVIILALGIMKSGIIVAAKR